MLNSSTRRLSVWSSANITRAAHGNTLAPLLQLPSSRIYQHSYLTASPASSRASSTHSAPIPRVADPSLWSNVVPSFLRRSPEGSPRTRREGWNPATFFIVIFLLIGSQSIHILGEKRSFQGFTRRTEAKIGLLKEALERLQKGEDVDVEKLLGTGDPEKEAEWDDVIKEVETQDAQRHEQARKGELQRIKEEAERRNKLDASPINQDLFENGQGERPPEGNFY